MLPILHGKVTVFVVNAAGRGRRTLTVPGEVDGRPVTALASDTFAGCSTLEKLTIQQNITALPGWTFAECSALQEITLTQPDPRAAFRGAGPARRCARILPHPRCPPQATPPTA